jgi:hypothetical protein
VPRFDHDFVNEMIARFGALDPETPPRWGRLDVPGCIAHLADTMRYSMGQGPRLPDMSNWATRTIVGPLLMRGILPIPRNVRVRKLEKAHPESPFPPADLETLHAIMEEYLALVQAGELQTRPHPVFGDIGVDGWAMMHVRHFEHHLKQFNA